MSTNLIPLISMGGILLMILLFCLHTPSRRGLAYVCGGLLYGLFLELICRMSLSVFPMRPMEGYLIGLGLSLILLTIWLTITETKRQIRQRAARLARQIEHRPISCTEIVRPMTYTSSVDTTPDLMLKSRLAK